MTQLNYEYLADRNVLCRFKAVLATLRHYLCSQGTSVIFFELMFYSETKLTAQAVGGVRWSLVEPTWELRRLEVWEGLSSLPGKY